MSNPLSNVRCGATPQCPQWPDSTVSISTNPKTMENVPEITFEQIYHSRLRTNYSADYVIGDIQFSGSVTEDASGNQSFEPSWFYDEKSEAYYAENWEQIEDDILNAINQG